MAREFHSRAERKCRWRNLPRVRSRLCCNVVSCKTSSLRRANPGPKCLPNLGSSTSLCQAKLSFPRRWSALFLLSACLAKQKKCLTARYRQTMANANALSAQLMHESISATVGVNCLQLVFVRSESTQAKTRWTLRGLRKGKSPPETNMAASRGEAQRKPKRRRKAAEKNFHKLETTMGRVKWKKLSSFIRKKIVLPCAIGKSTPSRTRNGKKEIKKKTAEQLAFRVDPFHIKNNVERLAVPAFFLNKMWKKSESGTRASDANNRKHGKRSKTSKSIRELQKFFWIFFSFGSIRKAQKRSTNCTKCCELRVYKIAGRENMVWACLPGMSIALFFCFFFRISGRPPTPACRAAQ